MRKVVLLWILAIVHAGSGDCKEPDPDLAVFDKMFENMDVNKMIRNPRIVEPYLNCFLNTGNCTHLGNQAKAMIPEIIRTDCEKCGDNQKKAIKTGLRLFITLRPLDWEKCLDVYDPERKEWPHFKKFLESQNEQS